MRERLAAIMAKDRTEVVATFFLDFGFCVFAGLLLGGASGSRDLATPSAARAFRYGLAYVHGGVLSIALLFYGLHPDWMWQYWVDASRLPVPAVLTLFALYPACYVAGYAAGVLPRRSAARVITAMLVAVSWGAFAAGILEARVQRFGTLQEFESGSAPLLPIRETVALTVLGSASLVALVLLVRKAKEPMVR